uniref:C2H2-type domain-containing protein n=1 Tax=Oncorhynchus tshawytscha TaxID=74940 RepID=A0A8C8LWE9_ONCTS
MPPSFRDTESKGEPMRAVVPEETGSGRGSHARETSSRTANGTESTENSHGIQQSISKPRKPFKCDICEKTFHANCLLKRHIAVHNKPKGPFKCDICAKTFRLNCMLTQHMQTHSKEKPFSCKVCGKKFRSKTNLKSHEFVHAEVKPFTCLTCGRGFASKYMLDVHQRVHTGEKPYSCTTCGKNFSISQNLKTHIRSVHTELSPHSEQGEAALSPESLNLSACL